LLQLTAKKANPESFQIVLEILLLFYSIGVPLKKLVT